ncbi:GAF domain-containing protein [Streptomyces sp. DT195]|uniref:GAF domain-containing protein n=1 Tax=Streptomyces sp. DT195 TaxID=3393419 RepID=UPI003CE9F17F
MLSVPQPELVTPGEGDIHDQVARALADEAAERSRLFEELGLQLTPQRIFDDFAEDLGRGSGFLYAFVNLISPDGQHFAGLYQPPPGAGYPVMDRGMRLDHGWCPHVVHRRRSLPLHNVHAAPQFSGNPVVDAAGITSYYGAPLIHESGTCLGTVCIADPEPRQLSDSLKLRDQVAAQRDTVMRAITTGAHRR